MGVVNRDSDAELVARLATDDLKAFEAIYRKYAAVLLRYCYGRIGNKEESEEVIQDIFESLWSRRQELQHVVALQPYLFNMVKYKIIDHIRHSVVRKKYEEHYMLFEAVYDNFSEQVVDATELQGFIEKSIAELPARCQTAFRLRLNDNLPYKDIAHKMNISIKTVEKHIGAALQHLRTACQNTSYRAG